MRLSNNTLAILNNFSSINSNILVRPGNVLRTISESGEISAKAVVSEDFETEFAIYDLPQFLKGLRLYDNPELEFAEDSSFVLIKQNNHTIKYFLTEPDLVTAPENRNLKMPSAEVEFELRSENFEKLIKASNVYDLPDFTVLGKDGEITLQVRNKMNPTSNQVSITVGETDDTFELNFDKKNLLMIEGAYDVVISKQMISQFTNQDFDLSYFVGLSSDSYFED
jgi:hypothetical protein